MCGRYNIATNAQGLYDAFKILSSALDFSFVTTNYNVHPSPPDANETKLVTAPIIRFVDEKLEALPAVWPLIPKWANGRVTKYSTANAKSETLTTTRSYQGAWKQGHRCLVPATGFYEWQVVEGQRNKQPYNIQITNSPVFAMAGLWEESINPDTQQSVQSFTIITTSANPLMAEIHNTKKRMPVIISPANYSAWLTGNTEEGAELLSPFPAAEMQAYKVSTAVNNPYFNELSCIDKLDKP